MRTITRVNAVMVAREGEERLLAARAKKRKRESVVELNESGEKSIFVEQSVVQSRSSSQSDSMTNGACDRLQRNTCQICSFSLVPLP